MTFEEFLEKCREKDGWQVMQSGRRKRIRNRERECPLQAVFGWDGYADLARAVGLRTENIMDAADGFTNGPYRKALLTLVKPS